MDGGGVWCILRFFVWLDRHACMPESCSPCSSDNFKTSISFLGAELTKLKFKKVDFNSSNFWGKNCRISLDFFKIEIGQFCTKNWDLKLKMIVRAWRTTFWLIRMPILPDKKSQNAADSLLFVERQRNLPLQGNEHSRCKPTHINFTSLKSSFSCLNPKLWGCHRKKCRICLILCKFGNILTGNSMENCNLKTGIAMQCVASQHFLDDWGDIYIALQRPTLFCWLAMQRGFRWLGAIAGYACWCARCPT